MRILKQLQGKSDMVLSLALILAAGVLIFLALSDLTWLKALALTWVTLP